MNLVIVESPAKAHTIKKFLGRDFEVTASLGHIKDLPQKTLGVDVAHDFAPRYESVPGKKKVVDHIRQAAANADRVYIATDPDREGEAIASHVADVIRKSHPRPHRVLFQEITRHAVQKAIDTPGLIDQRKVDAQIARRVVDRLVGYQVSPFIWKTVAKGLSAGRVQSVTLRLVCEREQEIRDFVPQEYWTVRAQFSGRDVPPFWTDLVAVDGKKTDLPHEAAAKSVTDRIRASIHRVTKFEKSESRSKPSPPYTTSTLQQDAGRRLRLTSKRIMALAQALYEGVDLPDGESAGLITYMRTDSTRVASEAQSAARSFIQGTFGANYAPAQTRNFATKKGAQDAHEAIRPTDVGRTPQSLKGVLDPAQWKLYDLIWRRFMASQMADAVFDVTTVEVTGDGTLFRARGQVCAFDGYLKVYDPDTNREEALPAFPAGFGPDYPLDLKDLESKQRFTQPPARYTEATLIKTLDELGIGRPSTYATIVGTLFDRKYVEREERKLTPTGLGETVNKILVNLFPDIFEVGFTARMEEQLDQVEENGTPWVQVVRDFYQPFQRDLQEAEGKRKDIKEKVQEVSDELCDKCGSPMVIKWSRRGQFLACSAFPNCRNTRPLDAPQTTGKTCPNCGAELVVKEGRYGRFLGCPNYPKCKHLEPLTTGIACPTGCGGELVERSSKKGRFYSCTNYPECKYRTWQKPEPVACPQCGHPFMVHARAQDDGRLTCPRCKAVREVRTESAPAEEAGETQGM
ncbi:MAG: type I DNA topoisomerase [Candidatus Zixiibacteriota bacterium]|nr:MAG: type I DNA topoisomerase [candidate division Zixibacteria bacterium]